VPLDESGSRERHGLELDEPVIDAPGRLLGFVNAFGDWACRPPPDALRPGSDNRNGERRSGVGARRSSPRVLFSGLNQMGVGERRSSARVRVPGKLPNVGKVCAERSPARGYTVSGQPWGNRVARSSVRPVAADEQPERVEATAPAPVSGSYAAAVERRPELVMRSNRSVRRQRSRSPLRRCVR